MNIHPLTNERENVIERCTEHTNNANEPLSRQYVLYQASLWEYLYCLLGFLWNTCSESIKGVIMGKTFIYFYASEVHEDNHKQHINNISQLQYQSRGTTLLDTVQRNTCCLCNFKYSNVQLNSCYLLNMFHHLGLSDHSSARLHLTHLPAGSWHEQLLSNLSNRLTFIM